MESKRLLNRIKAKGGIYGKAAEMYINDDEKADLFIRECAEQCHNKLAKELWGEELILDIIKYNTVEAEKNLPTDKVGNHLEFA